MTWNAAYVRARLADIKMSWERGDLTFDEARGGVQAYLDAIGVSANPFLFLADRAYWAERGIDIERRDEL